MVCALVFADDATGALEAGAFLVQGGLRAIVSLHQTPPVNDELDAAVLMLPTRHLADSAAREALLSALQMQSPVKSVYWKTDSTLRGPIGVCLQTLMDAFPNRLTVYVPAYPAVGRIVKLGILHVNGLPVDQTAFANDPLNPVRTSSVVEVAQAGCSLPVILAADKAELRTIIETRKRCVIVCDSETDAQVEGIFDLCRQYAGSLLMAGPAGGISHWVRWFDGAKKEIEPLPPIARWLVVNGSRHPVSREQAHAAAALGLQVIESSLEDSPVGAREAQRLAFAAVNTHADAMMIFGGDTALAIWRELGIETLTPLKEVLPGVAVSRSGATIFVTKAGGFGSDNIVERVLERWNK